MLFPLLTIMYFRILQNAFRSGCWDYCTKDEVQRGQEVAEPLENISANPAEGLKRNPVMELVMVTVETGGVT